MKKLLNFEIKKIQSQQQKHEARSLAGKYYTDGHITRCVHFAKSSWKVTVASFVVIW
jgi:hypothetical protein